MSYLLDALKKAESERASLEVESSDASEVVVQQAPSLPVWLIVVTSVLLVITIWKLSAPVFDTAQETGGQLESTQETTTGKGLNDDITTLLPDASQSDPVGFIPTPSDLVVSENQSIKESTRPSVEEYQLKVGEVLITPGSTESLFESEQVATNHIVSSTDYSDDKSSIEESNTPGIKQLAELTKTQLRSIPSLSLQSHLYSSVAEYSSVVINGRNYSEGDFINSEIVIKKINIDGIVISLGELFVELPKGISWVSQNNAK